MNYKLKSTSRGMALITVLLLTVLLVLMTSSMLFISTNHSSLIGDIEGKEKALKAAEAGIEYAIGQFNQNTAWGLDGEPVFIDKTIIDPNDTAKTNWPVFVPEDGNTIDENYDSDCGFSITFSPDPETGSVNNLFNPVEDPNTGAPPYTAKIVSTGKFFSPANPNRPKVVRTLVAYIVRSEYSPYNINVAGRVIINEVGEGSVTIRGKDEDDKGSLYSGKCVDPGYDDSIVAGRILDSINTNGGIFYSMGTIEIPPSVPFDGDIVENLPIDYSVPAFNVKNIVDSSGVASKSGGTITFKNKWESWQVGSYHSRLVIDQNTSSLSIGNDSCDFTIIEEAGYGAVLRLNNDIHISSDLKILGTDNPSKFDTVIKNRDSKLGWISDDDPCSKDTFGGERGYYLDLNGNNIYADDNVLIGLSVTGEGGIFSKNSIHYLMGVNTDDTVTVAENNLTLEVPKSITASTTGGLYYAGGDMAIQPLTNASPLYWGWGVDLPETIIFSAPSKRYPYTTTNFTSENPPYKPTTLGRWVPRDYHAHPPVYWSHYEGANMLVAKVLDKQSGNYVLYATCLFKDLEFSLDYDDKRNINFENNIIKISEDASGVKVVLLRRNFEDSAPLPAGLSSSDFKTLGEQIKYRFDNLSGNVDINFSGAIIIGEQDPPVYTEFILNAGGNGNINMGFSGDYMNSLVNVVGKEFKVKKISSYEL